MSAVIIVTGGVTARPETFEALRAACIAHSERSRREPGCILHTIHVDAEDPLHLFFYEQWEDAAALKAHLYTDDLAGFVREAQALAASADKTRFHTADPTPRAVVMGA